MIRWPAASTTALVLTGFTLLLLTGRYREEGDVLLTVTATHGLHRGDLFVLAGWLVGMACTGVLLVLSRPQRHPDALTPSDPGRGGDHRLR